MRDVLARGLVSTVLVRRRTVYMRLERGRIGYRFYRTLSLVVGVFVIVFFLLDGAKSVSGGAHFESSSMMEVGVIQVMVR